MAGKYVRELDEYVGDLNHESLVAVSDEDTNASYKATVGEITSNLSAVSATSDFDRTQTIVGTAETVLGQNRILLSSLDDMRNINPGSIVTVAGTPDDWVTKVVKRDYSGAPDYILITDTVAPFDVLPPGTSDVEFSRSILGVTESDLEYVLLSVVAGKVIMNRCNVSLNATSGDPADYKFSVNDGIDAHFSGDVSIDLSKELTVKTVSAETAFIDGDTIIEGKLRVQGDAFFENDATFSEDVTFGDSLQVLGQTDLRRLAITGAYGLPGLTIEVVEDQLAIQADGAISTTKSLYAGDMVIGGGATCGVDMYVGNTLTAPLLEVETATVSQNLNVTGTLIAVTGSVQNLAVANSVSITAALTVGGTLTANQILIKSGGTISNPSGEVGIYDGLIIGPSGDPSYVYAADGIHSFPKLDAAQVYHPSDLSATNAWKLIPFSSVVYDNHGSWRYPWWFLVITSGYYFITVTVRWDGGAWSSGQGRYLALVMRDNAGEETGTRLIETRDTFSDSIGSNSQKSQTLTAVHHFQTGNVMYISVKSTAADNAHYLVGGEGGNLLNIVRMG